jgi:hypothetical protein
MHLLGIQIIVLLASCCTSTNVEYRYVLPVPVGPQHYHDIVPSLLAYRYVPVVRPTY